MLCCWSSVALLLSIFLCHTASNEPDQWSPLSLPAVLIVLLQGGMVLVGCGGAAACVPLSQFKQCH
jgi:hypothetical protein